MYIDETNSDSRHLIFIDKKHKLVKLNHRGRGE
ncbi:hypothetical protein D3OALGA1CA_4137 [Olavius algarvensis associated proteobacterium Delta 3]|nr:hypothetical protein D3OALGA1CA_4137 [Olavius algarvensis associated proteobacterium Delta 3]